MEPGQLKLFIEKYALGENTEEEHQAFINWLKSAPINEVEVVLDEYEGINERKNAGTGVDINLVSRIQKGLDQYELGNAKKNKPGKIVRWRLLTRIAAAVLITFIAGYVVFLTLGKNEKKNLSNSNVPSPSLENEAFPGTNKAILTLSDGSTISLDDAGNGQLAEQGGTEIAKLADGQVVYNIKNARSAEVLFNTLATPRGGQFKLTLPDGSDVWLNSSSSIKYPTAFAGHERKVEISGEAYFEIAHNASKPFLIDVNGLEVRVLGTHFNINAYADESSVKTTLLQGSVRLTKADAIATLKPGQQAELGNYGNIKLVDNVDLDRVVAWKNGYFSFDRADLQTVMRQLARWYDVDISYEGKIPERLFGGKISRNSNASEVLKILRETKVNFRIEGKKIIVTP